jgi:hypothetical protein
MNLRELILLSPYRLPAQNSLMLANEDAAAFLNGYTALWHPAAASGAASPPRVSSAYDHEQPTAGHLYAVPDSPPLLLPEDWEERARAQGALVFHATADRRQTLENLQEALVTAGTESTSVHPNAEQVASFLGIGFGHLVIEALFEAMEHENTLSAVEFWQEVQEAVSVLSDSDPSAWRNRLQAAAERLLAAREVLYPATIHLLDLCLLEEERLQEPLPTSFSEGLPLNVLASASLLEAWGRTQTEPLAVLRERVAAEQAEVCGGPYLEREDALLPLESQLWNLLKGQATYKRVLGAEVRVFGRKRSAAQTQLPLLLTNAGLRRALLVAFDEGVLPSYRSNVVSWSSPDGKQVDAFTRAPYAADNVQTFFHAAHYLHKTIMQDHAATLALVHRGGQAAPWYDDWIQLTRLAPVLGRWTTFSGYFNDVTAGEYTSAASPDEFHGDYLSERVTGHVPGPVSWFAQRTRARRRVDTLWTLAALYRGLTGAAGPEERHEEALQALEDQVETDDAVSPQLFDETERKLSSSLAQRLLARPASGTPGYLLLNPCSYTRRVALELEDVTGPLPIAGPLKACQVEEGKAKVVVEVPALGFAWFPRSGPPGTPPQAIRMRLADRLSLRNEFFEAEIDPTTGGLRALRDHRTRSNRLGQQLIYNPGSTPKVREVRVTSSGPALGEIVSEGELVDPYQPGEILATFRQRFRAWLGRPVLEVRIEITPRHSPQGYAWHAYHGARFAWRDERALLMRGVNGTPYTTSQTRPETPDFVELRSGRHATFLFPGGLPFHQRHGSRMLDVLLIPEGETCSVFELGIGLDRDYPMLTAQGLVSPAPLVETAAGPPHIGDTGWLFHLDAPNLLLTSLRPAPDGEDAILARLLECSGHSGSAELRCARDPQRASLLDAQGTLVTDASTHGDAAQFDVSQGDLVHVRVDFR